MYNPDQPVFEEQPESNIEIAYGIEDVPKPLWKAVLFALQITLVDFTPFMWAAGFCVSGDAALTLTILTGIRNSGKRVNFAPK